MTLRIVGAGLPRTGTNSLQLALERLLGAPCYHMLELFEHLDHVPVWQRAVDGETVDWEALFDGYPAAVDWPASAFWPELTAAYPDAFVLLSTRSDPATWWRSMEGTVLAARRRMPSAMPPDHPMAGWGRLMGTLTARFCAEPDDPAAMTAAYERHNAAVRAAVPAGRLIDWQPGDGWAPLCAALQVPEPGEPFPHVNTTAEFNARLGEAAGRRPLGATRMTGCRSACVACCSWPSRRSSPHARRRRSPPCPPPRPRPHRPGWLR